MAFTGVAVVQKVTDKKVRITGLSLAAAATGTISQAKGAGAVKFGDIQPDWNPYQDVSLIEAVQVTMNTMSDVTTSIPIRVTKTGTDPTDFLITLENDSAATASPDLEIWIEFH